MFSPIVNLSLLILNRPTVGFFSPSTAQRSEAMGGATATPRDPRCTAGKTQHATRRSASPGMTAEPRSDALVQSGAEQTTFL